MARAILGIDIGTTSICGVAVSRGGDLLASVERPNDSAVPSLAAGRAQQAPLRIRERAYEVIRELAGQAGGVECVGFTGQMHGMLCVDADGTPLGNLITWQDGRCLEPAAPDGRTWLDLMRGLAQPDAWDVCGCLPASGFLGSTLFWMCRNGAVPRDAARVCFVHDWIASQLTGEPPTTDPTDAGSAGIFDVQRMNWHAGLIRDLDLPASLLPPVRRSGEVIGSTNPSAAAATGLPPGTPVCNALGDNQASVLGSVAEPDRTVLVNIGTGGQISWVIPTFHRVGGMETRALPHDRLMLVGATLCGGRAYAWLNDTVCGWLSAFGGCPDRAGVYARLNELAASAPPGCGGVRAITTFAGTRSSPQLRGGFEGLSLDNFSSANAARAVLEGLVDELCLYHDRVDSSLKRGHEAVVASGNAIRKNPLLREILSARLGLPVLLPCHREEAAYGAALVAGTGAGVWNTLADAARVIRYQT